MKILFIYPSLCNYGFNTDAKKIIFQHKHRGLCYLSAICKKHGYTDISLIDLRMIRGWEEYTELVKDAKADIAAVTLVSMDYTYAIKCIDIIKAVSKNTKVIIGGMHPTIKTEEMALNKDIDYIITKEGESAFIRLLDTLSEGKVSDKIIHGELADVNKLPFEDRELFDCLEMPYDFFLPLPFVTVLASRGCPYYCKFCAPGSKFLHGDRIRKRSVDSIISELIYLRDNYGFKSLMFWDDCFASDKKWVIEFCKKYKSNGFNQPFICQTRADIIAKNPDMIKLLRKAGLVMNFIGFESGNPRILKFVNKGATISQYYAAAKICKRLGIKIWSCTMLGLPTETNKEALDTFRMIRNIKPYRSSVAFFTPFPGSYLHNYCKENDLLLIDDYDSAVALPENDKPKIKNIDYDYMRKLAIASKRLSIGVKFNIRIERLFIHKKNKEFRKKFEQELKKCPDLNKMAVLRKAHTEGRL